MNGDPEESLDSFHPERVLFRPGAVGPPPRFAAAYGGGECRISTLREAVPKYASAQPLDFLASTKNASSSNRNLAGRGIRSGVCGWALDRIFGPSGKRVPARRERTVSVYCELALWGPFDFVP